MQQIAVWLKQLGMSEYAQRFVENRIDFSVLPDLTDQDLEKLGVVLGDRRKMLRAIRGLGDTVAASPHPATKTKGQDATERPQPAPILAAAPPQSISPTHPGERRYLTVMFCDLVGSTGIAAQLDAEEWRDLVGAYLDAATAAVTEMGGHVAKKLGDGLMALFGYPAAQENDAERAARAALSIQRALAELNRKNASTGKPELTARIGLEAGLAVVDATGEIFGDVANIAARVQALADPGSVVITARVQRQIAGLFIAEDCGSHELKGVPELVTLFRLVRASGAGRRAGQRHLTPLIGRDEEMAMLMRRWQRALHGEGQLVLIVGEPGLGKSRLIEEFHARLGETPHSWAEWTCSQLLQNTPLHPIVEWSRMRFGGADIPAEQRLADLESSLAQVKLDPGEYASLLAPMLDIPLPKERVPTSAPEELRRRQLAAVSAWAIAGAQVQPVVLALEDVHWADPTTLEVVRGIAERGALAPLFILITARPEFRPPWSMRSHHGTISLAPLDPQQVRHMVSELAALHALPKDVIDRVTERTGGVPLFVEEVTRLLLESGAPGGVQAIPLTLQQSLTARLDRLGSARDVAQIGAVIGRGFSFELIRAVTGIEDAPLQAALERLAEADILLVQGLPPNADYTFKHALVQDAAYSTLLRGRRQQLHGQIAATLESQFAEIASAQPQLMAQHFTEAGLTDKAIDYWLKAGQQAIARSAMTEAVSQLQRGLDLLASLPDTPSRQQQELDLRVTLGLALMATRGYAAPEVGDMIGRARALAEQLDRTDYLIGLLNGQCFYHCLRAEHHLARSVAEQMEQMGEACSDRALLLLGHYSHGVVCYSLGQLVVARELFGQCDGLDDPANRTVYTALAAEDPYAGMLVQSGLTLAHLGYLDQAQGLVTKALAEARRLDHAYTLAFVLGIGSWAQWPARSAQTAQRQARELTAVANERGFPFWAAWGTVHHGWSLTELGQAEEGRNLLAEGFSVLHSTGQLHSFPWIHILLAEADAKLGQPAEGLSHLADAMRLIEMTDERIAEAEAHRLRGDLLNVTGDQLAAEESYQRALAVARGQSARTPELHVATSLARLWRDQGKHTAARDLLAPIYGWFTEGFDTPVLREAKALLDALAPSS
jgi:class 3 adenylate cyclase/tetratricopeptide (TPR) repeat protein